MAHHVRHTTAVLVLAAAAAAASAGCESASVASAPATAVSAGKSLVDQLGGLSKVSSLADAFGTNLSQNPAVSKFLNPASIDMAKKGLVNQVATTSGMDAPNPGSSLLGAFSGKGLDKQGVTGITDSLSKAADSVNFNALQKESILNLMQPVTKALLGG